MPDIPVTESEGMRLAWNAFYEAFGTEGALDDAALLQAFEAGWNAAGKEEA